MNQQKPAPDNMPINVREALEAQQKRQQEPRDLSAPDSFTYVNPCDAQQKHKQTSGTSRWYHDDDEGCFTIGKALISLLLWLKRNDSEHAATKQGSEERAINEPKTIEQAHRSYTPNPKMYHNNKTAAQPSPFGPTREAPEWPLKSTARIQPYAHTAPTDGSITVPPQTRQPRRDRTLADCSWIPAGQQGPRLEGNETARQLKVSEGWF